MSLSRTLLTVAAFGAAAIAPSAAQAEGFTAVTSDGHIAHFHSDTRPRLSPKLVKVTGLAAGERIVGLDRAPELLALTSAGRIAVLDATTGKATPKLAAPVTGPVDPQRSAHLRGHPRRHERADHHGRA